MKGKIALEEHFAIPETLNDSKGFLPDALWPELSSRILDIHGRRIEEMDRHGVEIMILSLNAPAVQAIPDAKKAAEIARRANDYLAAEIAKRPSRFRGFAALAMQDPDEATRELQRCVKELGFVGSLVNGFSQVHEQESMVYLDDARYAGFWSECAKLEAPLYLHPRNPLPSAAQIYAGHPWLLGPTWAFAQETAVHALRLMASGLFDRHPGLQIVLGHMGEGLPYSIWRCDNRNKWTQAPPRYPAKRLLGDYLRENFHITTSGNFRTPALIDAMLEVGSDRLMFSVDWPFENVDHAAQWFDAVEISEADRLKIGRGNAVKLFKLDL
ncbi:MAG TPA: amidohydrolase family protein [Burkholderiales bacterium]|nr:amidohydrolase family protein [Burkholderiales bacterium]